MAMARSRPTAVAYAKLGLVLAFIMSIALVHVPARAAPGGNADLSITGSTSSPGVKVGHDLTFTLKGQNHGPDAAANVTVEVVLDTDLTIVAADASGGTCTTVVVVVCNRSALAASGSFTLTVRAATTGTGPADATAVVESDTRDGDLTNNSASFTAQVGPASSMCDLWGTGGNDRIVGGPRGEVICGRGGNDRPVGSSRERPLDRWTRERRADRRTRERPLDRWIRKGSLPNEKRRHPSELFLTPEGWST
jgi:uncharacterized repeat protein (TIGR01451 family)